MNIPASKPTEFYSGMGITVTADVILMGRRDGTGKKADFSNSVQKVQVCLTF